MLFVEFVAEYSPKEWTEEIFVAWCRTCHI